MELCSRRLLTHIFGALVALGGFVLPTLLKSRLKFKKKVLRFYSQRNSSSGSQALPGPRSQKINFFTTFTFLNGLASPEIIDSLPPPEGSGLQLRILISLLAQGMSWQLIPLPIIRQRGLNMGKCFCL